MLTAETEAELLYDHVPLTPDIERTRSRLIEMRSAQYLSLPHLAEKIQRALEFALRSVNNDRTGNAHGEFKPYRSSTKTTKCRRAWSTSRWRSSIPEKGGVQNRLFERQLQGRSGGDRRGEDHPALSVIGGIDVAGRSQSRYRRAIQARRSGPGDRLRPSAWRTTAATPSTVRVPADWVVPILPDSPRSTS